MTHEIIRKMKIKMMILLQRSGMELLIQIV